MHTQDSSYTFVYTDLRIDFESWSSEFSIYPGEIFNDFKHACTLSVHMIECPRHMVERLAEVAKHFGLVWQYRSSTFVGALAYRGYSIYWWVWLLESHSGRCLDNQGSTVAIVYHYLLSSASLINQLNYECIIMYPFHPQQGQKASRYSRQAHELLENGGLDDDDLMSEIILGPTESKRPRMMSGHIANSITMPTIAMEVTHNGQGQFWALNLSVYLF